MSDVKTDRQEQIREFIIRKYTPPGITAYEVMKEHYKPPDDYIYAIEILLVRFENATLEKRIDVLLELISFMISGRKEYLEGEIRAYPHKQDISYGSAFTLGALANVMNYTHDVGSKDSLKNLLDAIHKLSE